MMRRARVTLTLPNTDPIRSDRSMSRGTATALTVIRVPRGEPAPRDDAIRAAITRDRAQLHLPPEKLVCDFAIAGPYAITVDGQELDEYVVWEH